MPGGSQTALQPGARRDAQGRTLDQAEAEDQAHRRARAARVQQWIDRAARLKRIGPAWLLLPCVLPLGLLIGTLLARPLLLQMGLRDAEIIRWAAFTPRFHQVLMILLALGVIAVQKFRGHLLARARQEGLEVHDPEEPVGR